MKQLLFSFIILTSNLVQAQHFEPFTGKLTYEVIYIDSVSNAQPLSSFMTVYTNDTLVRIETETVQLGKQILIKNLPLKKYYILLDVNNQKYAIQHNEEKDTLNKVRYTFKNKLFGSKKIAGVKAKKTVVTATSTKKVQQIYYIKGINPSYTEAMKGAPGLPAEYYIQTEDGVFYYKLIEFSMQTVPKDLFGIPSDYQKVSFDDFIEHMINAN